MFVCCCLVRAVSTGHTYTPSAGIERLSFRSLVQTASVRGFTKQILGSLIGGGTVGEAAQNLLNATHLQQQPPRIIVAFVGSQIARAGDVAAQQGLQGFLDAAGSSLSLPNVLHKVHWSHAIAI